MDKDTIAGLALVLSITAGIVSIFSLAAATAKLKLDLYNRRFKIYEDVLSLYMAIWDDWDDQKVFNLERAMIRSLRESRFLFHGDDGIYEAMAKVMQASAKHSEYYRRKKNTDQESVLTSLREAASLAREECEPVLKDLEKKLQKYLDFRKVNGWM